MKKFLFVLSLLAASALAGCASPATVSGMTSSETPSAPLVTKSLAKNIVVTDVEGGESTNPMWESEVDSHSFKEALVNSLQVANLSSTLSNSRYYLSANLLELKKPLIGFDMTDTCKVYYQLIDSQMKQTVFDKDITTQYTAKFGDAFFGVERLRLANEGAVRTNIQALINDLYALNLK